MHDWAVFKNLSPNSWTFKSLIFLIAFSSVFKDFKDLLRTLIKEKTDLKIADTIQLIITKLQIKYEIITINRSQDLIYWEK
jgi:hypothetical protein